MKDRIEKELAKYPDAPTNSCSYFHVKGLNNLKGSIKRQHYLVSPEDFDTFIDLVKKDVTNFYPASIANQLNNQELEGLKKRVATNRDKLFLIAKESTGIMTYFVLLKKKIGNDYMIGTYKYKISFDLPKDMYITNYTYSQQEQDWFSSSSVFICVDSVHFKARGLTKEDIRILFNYATIMEDEFEFLQPEHI